MRIKLDVTKSLEQNAGVFFDKAKKARRKLEGARDALQRSFDKLEQAKKKGSEEQKKAVKKVERKKEWFEKFRWFVSSEGFLCIGGRDATTNEIVIKKHTDSGDFVFHTDIAGSPFFVIKSDGRIPGDQTKNEVAQACASYSRAWRLGITTTEVYMISPDQVRKELGLPKGSFMIHGKRRYFSPSVTVAVGIKDSQIIGGPVDAIKKNADRFVVVVQGKSKAGVIAKKIQKKLKGGDLDDIIRFLPSGSYDLK